MGVSLDGLPEAIIGVITFVVLARYGQKYIGKYLSGMYGAIALVVIGALLMVFADKAHKARMLVEGIGLGFLFYGAFQLCIPKVVTA